MQSYNETIIAEIPKCISMNHSPREDTSTDNTLMEEVTCDADMDNHRREAVGVHSHHIMTPQSTDDRGLYNLMFDTYGFSCRLI